MSRFQQAAISSNDGIASLFKGKRTSAIEYFTYAIRTMKTELAGMRTDGHFWQNTHATRVQRTKTVEIPSTRGNAVGDESIIFNQAIKVTATESCPTALDLTVHICSVIFNLALALHLKGLDDGGIYTRKAEQLYIMLLKLLEDKALLNVHTTLVVKLACINNLYQVRYSRGDCATALEVANHEVSSVMRQLSNLAMFDEPEIMSLLIRLMLLDAPIAAPAA